MSETQTYIGTLVVLTCGECHVPFGMTQEMYDRRLRDHELFYCPSGHGRHFVGKSEAERLRDDVARLTSRLDQERAKLRDFRGAMDHERQRATETARLWYSSNGPLRAAFWKGFDARKCGCGADACPYLTVRGGFRAAWFRGFGEEPPPTPKLLSAGVVEADYEVLP